MRNRARANKKRAASEDKKSSPTTAELIAIAIPAIPLTYGLIFWTGRWYKEWYFNQFQVPYEILGFDYYYYVHGSWATIAVALSYFVFIVNFLLTRKTSGRLWQTLSLILCLAPPILLLTCLGLGHWFWHFDPLSIPYSFLGSPDVLMISGGIIVTIILAYKRLIEKSITFQLFIDPFRKNIIGTLIIFFLGAGAYFMVVGYLMGIYHGKAAIWEGKMGVKWAKAKGAWWILTVRTSDGRNFLFDRYNNKTIIVEDKVIEEINGPVTRDPK